MLLTQLLDPNRIAVPLRSADKEGLLRELVEILARDAGLDSSQEVLRAVREREEVLSTGIGNGVAIPHGKCEAVAELTLAAGVTREPVDFEALDGRPVSLFFLLVGPETSAGDHVKALSRISRLLRSDPFRQRLLDAGDAESFYAALQEAERS